MEAENFPEHEATGSVSWKQWWQDVSDSIRGVPHDYTKGRLERAIFLLAIPMVLEMFMQSIFAVCDAYFVAKLGSAAVATVGISESILVTVIAVGLGLSIGTVATVARRVGEKDVAGARRATVQAILLGLGLSIIIGVVGANFAPQFLRFMEAPEEVMEIGQGFATHILGGSGTIMMLFIINAAFRGAGDPSLALRALAIANVSNIILDPILIFGLGPVSAMGVTGAAVATNIGRGIGILYQLSVLLRGKGSLKIGLADFGIHLDEMTRLVRVSGVGIFQFVVALSSFTGLVRVMSHFDSDAIAGFTIAVRVVLFALLPAWGLSNAAATLVGQNLGAKNPGRAEAAVWKTVRYNLWFLGSVTVVFISLAPAIIRIFTTDAEVVHHGANCLRWVSSCYIVTSFGMVMVQSFNGAGDTWTPTYINLFSHWLVKISLAWILAITLELGPTGVFIAIPVAEFIATILAIYFFKKGRWKKSVV